MNNTFLLQKLYLILSRGLWLFLYFFESALLYRYTQQATPLSFSKIHYLHTTIYHSHFCPFVFLSQTYWCEKKVDISTAVNISIHIYTHDMPEWILGSWSACYPIAITVSCTDFANKKRDALILKINNRRKWISMLTLEVHHYKFLQHNVQLFPSLLVRQRRGLYIFHKY